MATPITEPTAKTAQLTVSEPLTGNALTKYNEFKLAAEAQGYTIGPPVAPHTGTPK